METIKILRAKKKDYSILKSSLENYLEGSIDKDTKKVGYSILDELKNINNYPDMFFIYAKKDNCVVGIANYVFDKEYGLSYHTISFIRNMGIGTKLFRKKIEYMLKKVDSIIAVKESEKGINLAKEVGFEKAPEEIRNILKLEGEKYFLKKRVCKI